MHGNIKDLVYLRKRLTGYTNLLHIQQLGYTLNVIPLHLDLDSTRVILKDTYSSQEYLRACRDLSNSLESSLRKALLPGLISACAVDPVKFRSFLFDYKSHIVEWALHLKLITLTSTEPSIPDIEKALVKSIMLKRSLLMDKARRVAEARRKAKMNSESDLQGEDCESAEVEDD